MAEGAQAWPQHDAHVPLMSLPHVLGLGASAAAVRPPYLTPDPARRARWSEAMGPRADAQLRIGVVHATSVAHSTEENPWTRRSCQAADLEPLTQAPGVLAFNLNLGRAAGQARAELPALRDLPGALTDFEDTAAVVSLMDALVCVDTAMVHVAGAIGTPGWSVAAVRPGLAVGGAGRSIAVVLVRPGLLSEDRGSVERAGHATAGRPGRARRPALTVRRARQRGDEPASRPIRPDLRLQTGKPSCKTSCCDCPRSCRVLQYSRLRSAICRNLLRSRLSRRKLIDLRGKFPGRFGKARIAVADPSFRLLAIHHLARAPHDEHAVLDRLRVFIVSQRVRYDRNATHAPAPAPDCTSAGLPPVAQKHDGSAQIFKHRVLDSFRDPGHSGQVAVRKIRREVVRNRRDDGQLDVDMLFAQLAECAQ